MRIFERYFPLETLVKRDTCIIATPKYSNNEDKMTLLEIHTGNVPGVGNSDDENWKKNVPQILIDVLMRLPKRKMKKTSIPFWIFCSMWGGRAGSLRSSFSDCTRMYQKLAPKLNYLRIFTNILLSVQQKSNYLKISSNYSIFFILWLGQLLKPSWKNAVTDQFLQGTWNTPF